MNIHEQSKAWLRSVCNENKMDVCEQNVYDGILQNKLKQGALDKLRSVTLCYLNRRFHSLNIFHRFHKDGIWKYDGRMGSSIPSYPRPNHSNGYQKLSTSMIPQYCFNPLIFFVKLYSVHWCSIPHRFKSITILKSDVILLAMCRFALITLN